jgi:hypothetical protein
MASDGDFKVRLNPVVRTANPFEVDFKRLDSPDYPAITQDEQRQGHVLFPGGSVEYEMKLTYDECPDIKDLKFFVEWSLSRRHLFHYAKELDS